MEKICLTPVEDGLNLSFCKNLMVSTNTGVFGRQLVLGSTVRDPCFGSEWMIISSILSNLNSELIEQGFTFMFACNCRFGSEINLMVVKEEVSSMIHEHRATNVLLR
jgi:hypothetical protein